MKVKYTILETSKFRNFEIFFLDLNNDNTYEPPECKSDIETGRSESNVRSQIYF